MALALKELTVFLEVVGGGRWSNTQVGNDSHGDLCAAVPEVHRRGSGAEMGQTHQEIWA